MKGALITICLAVFSLTVKAQPLLTPRNIALGGGGITYITDYNANFINPANLMIRDRGGNTHIGAFIGGFSFIPVQNFRNLDDQQANLELYLQDFEDGQYAITESERLDILDDHYVRDRSTAKHRARADVTLLGFKWQNDHRAFSIAARTRTSSNFEVGRGWYSAEPNTDESAFLDRTLNQTIQTLHEISFGYAEHISFLSDATSRLDAFSFGIAPKIVFGGAYQEAEWNNQYLEATPAGMVNQLSSFTFSGVGGISQGIQDYRSGVPVQQALAQNLDNEVLQTYGIGAGVDIGFTYLFTFGDDFSTLDNTLQTTSRSIRLSVSVTDLGFVNYDAKTVQLTVPTDTIATSSSSITQASDAFIGAPGQLVQFIDAFGRTNPIQEAALNNDGFSTLLPTSFNAGILVELNRLKLMGDLNLGLQQTAFNSPTLITSIGAELYVFRFLPVRAGTQFASELPSLLSLGAAIETRRWDLSIAAQFSTRDFNSSTAITGATVAALQFHF
ncbi:MAG: DUF5723 family protein [Bacteroidota bacterium]